MLSNWCTGPRLHTLAEEADSAEVDPDTRHTLIHMIFLIMSIMIMIMMIMVMIMKKI